MYTALETEMVAELWEVVYASEERIQTLASSSIRSFGSIGSWRALKCLHFVPILTSNMIKTLLVVHFGT